MIDQLPLGEGPNIPPSRRPRKWGIELSPLPFETTGVLTPHAIQITLIDRETGKRLGRRRVSWEEFRGVTAGLVLINVEEGVWE